MVKIRIIMRIKRKSLSPSKISEEFSYEVANIGTTLSSNMSGGKNRMHVRIEYLLKYDKHSFPLTI